MPSIDPPKYDSNWMNFVSCETCHNLHEEIKSLTRKLEQVAKTLMIFSMKSKDKRIPFIRPYKKKYSYVNIYDNRKSHEHKIRCHYCGRLGHTTPHCHIRKVEVHNGGNDVGAKEFLGVPTYPRCPHFSPMSLLLPVA